VCLIVLNAFAYKTQYEFCKFHVRNGKLRGWETCVVKGTLQMGIRAIGTLHRFSRRVFSDIILTLF
jgi:hypothetical protein